MRDRDLKKPAIASYRMEKKQMMRRRFRGGGFKPDPRAPLHERDLDELASRLGTKAPHTDSEVSEFERRRRQAGVPDLPGESYGGDE